MLFRENFISSLFETSNENFEEKALALFHYQYNHNTVYKQFVNAIGKDPKKIAFESIPFLPIEFFKTHKVISSDWQPQSVFESSGTTGSLSSKHYIKSLNHYLSNAQHIFENTYGSVNDYTILALLPSYIERGNSSLVAMVDFFIKNSKSRWSNFFLHDFEKLYETIQTCLREKEKILLIGVTYALLDFVERYSIDMQGSIVMETGGMKGRKKELVREEVHHILKNKLNTTIHSEYGMTEMLSQAYAQEKGHYMPPPWLRIITRDINDPFCLYDFNKRGAVNIIDLANADSCAFIATQDLGIVFEDYGFEILGRFDQADLRGCSLLTI